MHKLNNHSLYALFVSVFAIYLTACTATVTEEAIGRGNKRIYGVDCSGKAVPMSRCYEKAAQLCPRGYTIISREAKEPYNDPFPVTTYIARNIAFSIPGVRKGITIKCR